MEVTKEVIMHIADLAKLNMSEQACEDMISEMQSIVDFAGQLNGINTDEVDSMEHITQNVNVLREDVVCPSFTRDEMLKNAPEKYAGCYKVPKIVE